MSSFLAAIQAFGPRLVYNRTATTAEVARTLSGRTGLKHGQVLMVLRELQEVLIQYGASATPVDLDGLGRCRPTINRDGKLRLSMIFDPELASGVNRLESYLGEIINRANIGLDDAGYKALWDAAHPDDPLELPLRSAATANAANAAKDRTTGRVAERAESRATRRVARQVAVAAEAEV